ncbi:hypothetical protein D3C72_2302910 [compost metagenome]
MVRIVITADKGADLAVAFKDPALGHGVVDELTIVAHQQHGALIAIDQLFQQLQRFDVKIVGWFLENQ